ncbi:hypoxanthine phosphoribosyltransferase [bacterium]|nr:hypoxanthine phosphoribosyltransferase [bacterium]MBU1985298.1 hypoxanthine phosphoribosyltransferase [bacterium]
MIAATDERTSEIVGVAPYRFKRMISREEIHRHLRMVAARLREDYAERNPVFVGVLNGCFAFMADLVREVNIPCEVDFIRLSSYTTNMKPGPIRLVKDVDTDLAGRHVVVVEDIVDTGKSLDFLRDHLRRKKPASLVMATMFRKPSALAGGEQAEYVGMDIPDRFVVGYGLDYAHQWRYLADLYARTDE